LTYSCLKALKAARIVAEAAAEEACQLEEKADRQRKNGELKSRSRQIQKADRQRTETRRSGVAVEGVEVVEGEMRMASWSVGLEEEIGRLKVSVSAMSRLGVMDVDPMTNDSIFLQARLQVMEESHRKNAIPLSLILP